MEDLDYQRVSPYLTTEHSTLQGARNSTILESNGRLVSFLSTAVGAVVALAFVALVSVRGPGHLVAQNRRRCFAITSPLY